MENTKNEKKAESTKRILDMNCDELKTHMLSKEFVEAVRKIVAKREASEQHPSSKRDYFFPHTLPNLELCWFLEELRRGLKEEQPPEASLRLAVKIKEYEVEISRRLIEQKASIEEEIGFQKRLKAKKK